MGNKWKVGAKKHIPDKDQMIPDAYWDRFYTPSYEDEPYSPNAAFVKKNADGTPRQLEQENALNSYVYRSRNVKHKSDTLWKNKEPFSRSDKIIGADAPILNPQPIITKKVNGIKPGPVGETVYKNKKNGR